MIRTWKHNNRHYRLCRITQFEYDPRYVDPDEVCYNVIQTRRFCWLPWTTVREERVPNHAMLGHFCFGDTGEWRSVLFGVAEAEFGMPVSQGG